MGNQNDKQILIQLGKNLPDNGVQSEINTGSLRNMVQNAITKFEKSKEHNYGPLIYLLKRILELLDLALKGDIESAKKVPDIIKAASKKAKKLAETVEPKTSIEEILCDVLSRVEIRSESNNTVAWPYAKLIYILGGAEFLNTELDTIEQDGKLDVWYDQDRNRNPNSTKEILVESVEDSIKANNLMEAINDELYEFVKSFEDPESYFNRYKKDILAVEVIEKGKGDIYLKQSLMKFCQSLAQDANTPADVKEIAQRFVEQNRDPQANLSNQQINIGQSKSHQ